MTWYTILKLGKGVNLMSVASEKLDALVEAAIEDGDSIACYGTYDDELSEGHDVELYQHGGLFVVVEWHDGKESIEPFIDEEEARAAFDDVKEAIEQEESEV
jgi:hypothetical protein